MSGAAGLARNEAATLCAQGDLGSTKWTTPGITMLVEFWSVPAAYTAHCGDVLASKLPSMRSVRMLLIVTWRTEADAGGTFQMAQSWVIKGSWGAWDSTEVG